MVERACGPVYPVDIDIVIADPAVQVAAGYDRIQVHRSTSGEGGPYVELTTAGTRLPLSAAIGTYLFTDEQGSGRYWYKFRLYKSSTHVVSAFSDPQPGEVDPVLSICSIADLKTIYLWGVNLTDDYGTPYPDKLFLHYLRTAVSWLERQLDIPIIKQVLVDERSDFMRDDWDKWMMVQLSRHPVISVEEVSLQLPGGTKQVIPKDWLRVQRHEGTVQLVPSGAPATGLLLGRTGYYLPFAYSGAKCIPDAFHVKYTAGFGPAPEGSWGFAPGSEPASVSYPDPDLDVLPAIIQDLVMKIASGGPFNIAGDLVAGAAVASYSIGIDGLSQSLNTTSSATNAGYGARLIQYRQEIKDQIPSLKRYYHGAKVIAV